MGSLVCNLHDIVEASSIVEADQYWRYTWPVAVTI